MLISCGVTDGTVIWAPRSSRGSRRMSQFLPLVWEVCLFPRLYPPCSTSRVFVSACFTCFSFGRDGRQSKLWILQHGVHFQPFCLHSSVRVHSSTKKGTGHILSQSREVCQTITKSLWGCVTARGDCGKNCEILGIEGSTEIPFCFVSLMCQFDPVIKHCNFGMFLS